MRIAAAESGEVLASFGETAGDPEAIIGAIEKMGGALPVARGSRGSPVEEREGRFSGEPPPSFAFRGVRSALPEVIPLATRSK